MGSIIFSILVSFYKRWEKILQQPPVRAVCVDVISREYIWFQGCYVAIMSYTYDGVEYTEKIKHHIAKRLQPGYAYECYCDPKCPQFVLHSDAAKTIKTVRIARNIAFGVEGCLLLGLIVSAIMTIITL